MAGGARCTHMRSSTAHSQARSRLLLQSGIRVSGVNQFITHPSRQSARVCVHSYLNCAAHVGAAEWRRLAAAAQTIGGSCLGRLPDRGRQISLDGCFGKCYNQTSGAGMHMTSWLQRRPDLTPGARRARKGRRASDGPECRGNHAYCMGWQACMRYL